LSPPFDAAPKRANSRKAPKRAILPVVGLRKREEDAVYGEFLGEITGKAAI